MAWYGAHDKPERVDASALQHPEWDWVTVAVATCSRSCLAGAGERYGVADECVAGFNLMQDVGLRAPARVAALAQALRGEQSGDGDVAGGSGIACGSLSAVTEGAG